MIDTVSQPRTVAQAATELSLSQSTLRAWIANRRIGVVRLGRAVRVPQPEITRLLTDGFVPAVSVETR
jgi:excisionase family DNA binding protein